MKSITQLMDMTGRVVVITGGAGHIGRAMGGALVELGATVAVVDRDRGHCESAVQEFERLRSGSAFSVPCDLSLEEGPRECIGAVLQQARRLDSLIHCAGYVGTTDVPGWAVSFEHQSLLAWDQAMRINLSSAFLLAQCAREALKASGHGSIVYVSSIYGLVGPDMRLYEGTAMGNPAGYAASKGGLIQLTRYLSTLLAPEVRVNSISPGGVWRSQPPSFQERYVARTPLGRMAHEEDLKGAVAYLSSDLSKYVTGHNLVVDGGWTTW